MDTLAFWLPLILLFVSALLGTALKRKSRDHCLKKFEKCNVILPVQASDWQNGKLQVFAQGLELYYEKPKDSRAGKLNSYILHPSEVDKIPYFLRPAPDEDTRDGYHWRKELERIRRPNFLDKMKRSVLNFYNMLRDAFGQASQAILGAISKDSTISKVKNSDKQINELKSGLTNLVPNAWEPVLEKYRGHRIVVERKTSQGIVKESGILEDYSSKYLLVREVKIQDAELLDFLKNDSIRGNKKHDFIYNRSLSMIRHTVHT